MLEIIAAAITAAILAGAPVAAEPEEPYWVDGTCVVEPAECGACGAWVDEHYSVLSYDGTEWVDVCGSCYELFASEPPEDRAYGEQMARERS